jgi:hypothetical protein
VDVEIRPEPRPEEREAILAALEKLMTRDAAGPYVSAWRVEGIKENLGEAADEDLG